MRTLLPAILLTALSAAQLSALSVCSLTANTALVRSEGLTERLGDIILSCNGTANQAVAGNLSVAITLPFSNHDLGDGLLDIGLSIQTPNGFVRIADSAQRMNGSASVAAFHNINVSFDAFGYLALRIENIRAAGSASVTGSLAFNGSPSLLVSTPFVTLSAPSPSLMAGFTSTIPGYVADLPPNVNFNTLISLRIPVQSTRFTEGTAAAFTVKGMGSDYGTRLIVRYTNVPPVCRLLVPEYIAGSTALIQTSGGDMGLVANAGHYNSNPGGGLLLARVRNADINGAGGQSPTFQEPMGQVNDVDQWPDFWQVVYEVLDSNAGALETAQVPVFIWVPEQATVRGLVRQSAFLGPLSVITQASETAPIPRFREVTPPPDCTSWADCNAGYFPHLRVTANSSLSVQSPQNSGPQNISLTVFNEGGSVLEWTTRVSYLDGDGWLSVLPGAGYNSQSVMIYLTPGFRPTGPYRADVTFSADALSTPFTFRVVMNVVPPLPPPPPPPAVISSVVNAADLVPAAVAPGSIVAVTGGEFIAGTIVRVNGQDAPIISGTATQLLVVLPSALNEGIAKMIVYKGDAASIPFNVSIIEVAPAVFGILNFDWARNGVLAPAHTGDYIQVFGTGIPETSRPWIARIHDRWISVPDFAGPAPGQPGMVQFNFQVPADLPTMQTEVQICGTPQARPGSLVCSRGYKVWITQ